VAKEAKQYRWVCPECAGFKLASSRPKKIATVRFCLPCSEATGLLVERGCPKLDRARETQAERDKARRERAVATKRKTKKKARAKREETAEEKWHYGGYDLRVEATRLLKIARSEGYPCKKPSMTSSWRHKGGYATGRSWGGKVHLTIPKGSPAAPALVLLAHELAHEAAPGHHGSEWRWLFRALVNKGYGVVVEYKAGCSSRDLHKAAIQAVAAKLNEKLTDVQLEADEEGA
jgi:hypothetical protein